MSGLSATSGIRSSSSAILSSFHSRRSRTLVFFCFASPVEVKKPALAYRGSEGVVFGRATGLRLYMG